MVPREVDLNSKSEKIGGWTNPLGWTDDGTDDERILNMKFGPLGEDEDDSLRMPKYTLDEDILDSLNSEHDAEISVPKHMKRFKAEELKALEEEKEREKKLLEESESKRLKKNLEEPEEGNKEETKGQDKEGKKKKKGAKEEGDKEEKKQEKKQPAKGEAKKEAKKEKKEEAKEEAKGEAKAE